MKKVIVIGCPGSGKSTFSKALHAQTGIPLIHLDLLFWNADKTTVEKSVFMQRLRKVLAQDAWIIDGNYASTMELRLQQSDTVIFLDYPTEVCLQGIEERKGKARSDMPWVESGKSDEDFTEFIKNYRTKSRPQVIELLKKYPKKRVFVFQNRAEADSFLAQLQQI